MPCKKKRNDKRGKIQRIQAFIVLGIIITLLIIFGNQLGLFAVGSVSTVTVSGDIGSAGSKLIYDKNISTQGCSNGTSTMTFKYSVPTELNNLTSDIVGYYNILYSSNGASSSIKVSCNTYSLVSDNIFTSTNSTIGIPKSCVYYDTLNNNYKISIKMILVQACVAEQTLNYKDCKTSSCASAAVPPTQPSNQTNQTQQDTSDSDTTNKNTLVVILIAVLLLIIVFVIIK